MASGIKHPAKYCDSFFDCFAELLKGTRNVLDPFAGTGKIGKLKQYGYNGTIYANEIEREWLENNEYKCDIITFLDAEKLEYPNNFFEAICTSPTYGNRMADHFKARDNSRRNTYTHCLGHDLKNGNTGKMQFGKEYKEKHEKIYSVLSKMVVGGGGVYIKYKKPHTKRQGSRRKDFSRTMFIV